MTQLFFDFLILQKKKFYCKLLFHVAFLFSPVPKCLHADCNELLTEENKFLVKKNTVFLHFLNHTTTCSSYMMYM